MVFIRDEGSVLRASSEEIWEFFSSGKEHSDAHRHRRVRRRRLSGNSGRYSWEQDFEGTPTRFTMRWTAFPPLGLEYEVVEGPFTGSRFFLFYEPMGNHTAVSVVGEFVSPTIPGEGVEASVRRFFELEFKQDSTAIQNRMTSR
jgi:hypothetical protein